jgi:hypothetical protein
VFSEPLREHEGEADGMNNIRVNQVNLVAAVVVLSSALAMAQPPTVTASNDAVEESLTGTVTSTGRISHQYSCQRNQTLQTCTLASVQQGSQFVLMVGNKPFVLEVNHHMIEGYAGGKATVTGLVSNNHIQVRTVSNPKRELDDEKSISSLR